MEQIDLSGFKKNLNTIQRKIEEAAARAGRNPQEIEIMAVTKAFPESHIEIALQAGITLFGENRVLEAVEKYSSFNEQVEPHDRDLQLHLIGHLQRNKARKAVETFSCVQSIDRLDTALAIENHCLNYGKNMDILLEFNTSGEESKFGFRNTEELLLTLEQIVGLEHLDIRGLMTVGPFTLETEDIRRAFAQLKQLFQRLQDQYPGLNLDILSMGMSADYEIAVEEGSTLIRVGTALFGMRD